MSTTKEIVELIRCKVQSILEENGYVADLDEYHKFSVSLGDNGCVNYHILLDGLEGYDRVLIDVELKYDSKPEADRGHYVPDFIWYCLKVDGVEIIDEENGAYKRKPHEGPFPGIKF